MVFDGVCKLCARSVNFILAHERDKVIRFTAMQSASGQALLRRFGFDPQNAVTFVFIKGGKAHVRSDAALEIARHLRLPWRMLRVLRVVPQRPAAGQLWSISAAAGFWLGLMGISCGGAGNGDAVLVFAQSTLSGKRSAHGVKIFDRFKRNGASAPVRPLIMAP